MLYVFEIQNRFRNYFYKSLYWGFCVISYWFFYSVNNQVVGEGVDFDQGGRVIVVEKLVDVSDFIRSYVQ